MTEISRRAVIKGVAAAPLAAVVGWSATTQQWVTVAETCPAFDHLPPLKGQLVFDSMSLSADSTDWGQMVTATPCAVLRPGNAADVAAMVAYCAERGIRVAARGQAHSTYGQSLRAQLTIEMHSLNTIHSISGGVAEVDAGVLWRELLPAGVSAGWRPAGGPPDYLGLTIGGHAAVGGINPLSYRKRGAVDHILAVEVVTGTGETVYCSPTENPDLFAATLAGLGQCGVMTRAWVEMVPAPTRCRTYTLTYSSISAFFADCRLLADRAQVDGLYGLWTPPGSAVIPQLIVDVYYTDTPPSDALLLKGTTGATTSVDRTYLERVRFYDNLLTSAQTAGWGSAVKPWFDVIVPDAAVESYVSGLFGSLTASDISPTSSFLVFPVAPSTRPLFRMPAGRRVWLVDVLDDNTGNPSPSYTAEKIARNDSWWSQARRVGATRYPIGTMDFSGSDWTYQYGSMWSTFQEWKTRFDPKGILTPGPGITF